MKLIYAVVIFSLSLFTSPAFAWKPYTHSYTGYLTTKDLLDDGKVTINGKAYAVSPVIVEAIRKWPDYYNAGVVGPDGLPDMVYGQGIIHPGPTSSKTTSDGNITTGDWLAHLLIKAQDAQSDSRYTADQKQQIIAYVYGYLTHASGDNWGHTFINYFALGVFPAVGDIVAETAKLQTTSVARAFRHIISEGYVGNATPGMDTYKKDTGAATLQEQVFKPRTKLANGDWSNDSTPAVKFNVPVKFVYETLISPDAKTPLDLASPAGTIERGQLIGFFVLMHDNVQAIRKTIYKNTKATETSIRSIQKLLDALRNAQATCGAMTASIKSIWDCGVSIKKAFSKQNIPMTWDLVNQIAKIRSPADFWLFVKNIVTANYDALFLSYLDGWVQDLDKGLEYWPEFGLGLMDGLFDPESYRQVQNEECKTKGPDGNGNPKFYKRASCEDTISMQTVILKNKRTKAYINNHLLSMVGMPDVVGKNLIPLMTELTELMNTVIDTIGIPINPITLAMAEIQNSIMQIIYDEIQKTTGVDIEDTQSILTNPTAWMCLSDKQITQIGSKQLKTPLSVNLFAKGKHLELDNYLNMKFGPATATDPDGQAGHHRPNTNTGQVDCGDLIDTAKFNKDLFAAFHNTVVMNKLLLLGPSQLDQVLTDLTGSATPITFYQDLKKTVTNRPVNIMVDSLNGYPWLRMIDGDHAWRRDGLPRFKNDLMDDVAKSATPAPALTQDLFTAGTAQITVNGGTGQFPLWEKCAFRPAFRKLFKDWENGSDQFPDLGDACTN